MHGGRAWPRGARAPPAPAPAPAPAPVAALTAAQMFERMFSGFKGAAQTSSKMLTLQILYPENVLYKNDVVRLVLQSAMYTVHLAAHHARHLYR